MESDVQPRQDIITNTSLPGLRAAIIAPRLMRIKQATVYLATSPDRLRMLVQTGEIPYIPGDRPTSAWLFDIRDLDEWLERRKKRLM